MNQPSGQRPSPFKAASQYQTGLAAYEQGRYRDAIDLLSSLSGQHSLPGTLATFYLGQAHLKQGLADLHAGRYDDAAKHLAAARRINPESAGLSRYLTAAYVGQNRFDQVADELTRELTDCRIATDVGNAGAVEPASEHTHNLPIRLAHALAKDGQVDRAVHTLEVATAEQPWRSDLRYQLGLILASIDRYEQAATVFAAAAARAPLDAEIQLHWGLALGALQRSADAVAPLRQAHRLRPADAYIAQLLALALEAAKTPVEGLDPIASVDAVALAGDENAIETLGTLIAREPDFIEAFLRLPESAVDADVFAMLAATVDRALQRHPDFADLYYHCSRVYNRLGQTDAAVAAACAAVDINPRYVQALIQLAVLYRQTSRHADAVERLRAAIAAGGDYPDVHFLLGELFRESGDRDGALAEYRRALELNEHYDAARQAHDALLAA
jgi:tetratricopeptide (TPR) repeat protein